ncbi:MAG: acyl-CoA dehydrogenase family protein [Pseudomonadota bacterium]
MFDDFFTAEHRIFRDSFRKFVSREITPFVRQWERDRGLPRELWLKLGREGFLCPWMPEEYGGLGLGYEYSVIMGEELVRGDAFGTGIPLHGEVVSPYIHLYGSEEVKRKWLPRCRAGEAVCAIGMTEPDAGSDFGALKTSAVKNGDVYVVNGRKTFITNGSSADLVVLAAKTDPASPMFGLSLLLVEAGLPGFSRGRPLEKMGCHLADTAELFFDDCPVPVGNLLGGEGLGLKQLMSRLPEERLEIAVKCQAMAEEILKEALKYAKTRRAFGRPIGAFQHNAFKLAEMATEVELGRAFLDGLLRDYLAGRDIVKKVSMAKYWLSDMANRVADEAVQLHGGYGYMDEYRVCRMYKDIRAARIYAGTNEVMKLLISRQLGLRPS